MKIHKVTLVYFRGYKNPTTIEFNYPIFLGNTLSTQRSETCVEYV